MSQGTNLTLENRRAGGIASGTSRRLNTAVAMLISLPPVTTEDREKLHRAVDAIPTHESEINPAEVEVMTIPTKVSVSAPSKIK